MKNVFFLLLGCVATVRVMADPIPGLFNTGINTNGALLVSGSVDPHYRLVQSADTAFPGPDARVVNDTGFPIPPWMANGPNSKWIAPQQSQATGNQPGDYKYRITFDLSTVDHFTAVITGRWSSDNAGAGILLNGVETGITYDGNFGAFSPVFTINAGFLEGTNTLDFVVNNAPGPGINPTGFRAEVSGTADPLPPPDTPPSITQEPVSQTNGIGESATFSVKVRGSRPLSYQWRFNSEPIPNATDSSLTLNLLTPANAGEYDVVVTNPSGSDTSVPATLTIVLLSPAELTYEPLGPSSRRTGLAISEIMYHPKDREDGRNLEFVEIYNSNPFAENIGGYRFSGSFDYTFPPNTILGGNAFLVIAPVPADIEAEYSISGVLGGYTNNLPNNAGLVRLRKKSGAPVLDVPYQDGPPWPAAADGAGHSLVLAKASFGERDPQAWAASAAIGGSPGAADPTPTGPLEYVMINEIVAHTDEPLLDFLELYNYSPFDVDLSGCFLTDERNTNIFRIPDGTMLGAGDFLSFDQNQLLFALSAAGETVYFINSNATRVIDAVRFDAQANGVSYGRFPDGAPTFHELSARTAGAANAPLLIRPIVINEIMYNPLSGSNDDEYVELYNSSETAMDVGGWRLIDGISYTIPNGVMIPPNGYLVIAANTSRLLTNYPGLSGANVVGSFTGNLSNDGERLALAMPEVVVETNVNLTVVTNTYYVLVDEVVYRDGGRWGRWADGGGSSLELIDPHSDNRLAANWADSDETAKSTWTTVEHTGILTLGHNLPSVTPADQVQVFLMGAGEALLDDVQVMIAGSTNRLANSDFETGFSGWIPQGTQRLSGWESGEGYNSSASLRIRASDRGDHVANRVRAPLTQAIPAASNVTIRGKVRWLRGHPEILFRLKGNWLEAFGRLPVPANLGTPGAPNSQARANSGPAITEVSHRPLLPQPGQAIRISARVHDPDGLSSLLLNYRIDPSSSLSAIAMQDNGTNGDLMAGDGIFTGLIAPQPSASLIAFHIVATDGFASPAISQFPAQVPARECLVRVGDPPLGNGFGTYRFWMTQASHNFWAAREKMSNEDIDCTFIYGRNRVVYNMGAHYSGSSYTAPIYTSPTGALCGYDLAFPDDDLVLGEDHFTLDWPVRDDTNQREQLMYWFLEQFGLPNMYRRYINLFVNGVKRGTIYDDIQQPGDDAIEQWFEDDPDGNLYKTDCWNEFNDAGDRQNDCILNTLEIFATAGVKNVARYRWNWRPRATRGTMNDFSDLFALIDAANVQGAPYQSAVEGVVDMEHWMRTFCMNDLASFWDAFGNPNAKNTYLYKPENSGWKLFCWDFDVGLGVFNDPVNDPLFPANVDAVVRRMYDFPAFVRAYWRAMQEAMNGFFQVGAGTAIDFVLDSKYAAFQANGIALNSPAGIKSWITQRRNFILGQPQMNTATNAPFNVSGTNYITTSRNLITLSGTAPVRVHTILVNGNAYAPTWTALTTWSITLAVTAGTNELRIDALDLAGNTNATRTVTVEYTGLDEAAEERLVINEIMYNPLTSESSYVEIFNRSQNFSFDLSNWRIDGLGFTFNGGRVITNGQYLVIAKNRQAFASAYGWGIPALAAFGGQLDDGGETLTLLKPDLTVIDQVTYDDDPPWPSAPDGSGPALQLIDAAQDNNRVSNWSDGAGWKSFSYTASVGAGGNRFSLFLTNIPADVFIDDIAFVEGSVAGAGTNLILNGDFESPSLAPWNKTGLATNSAIDTTIARTGNQSLHLVYAAGSPALTHFYQDLTNVIASGVKPNTTYTLSFWYLSGTNSHLLQTRLNSAYRTAIDARPIGFTPGAANNIARPLPPYPPLWLSEVQPENITGPTDTAGDRDPWVELYLAGLNNLSLNGYYLSDNYANLRQWAFPSAAAIDPSQFMLVWADAEPGESTGAEFHTSFRLNPTNGAVALSRDVDGMPQIVDYINYRNVPGDRSFGAFPDGQSSFRGNFYYPTPGATNNPTGAPLPVFINEWMAANSGTLADPADGDFEDWFELYNASSIAVNLGGYTLTDSLGNPRKYTIPAGFTIPPHGYALFWADEEGNQNRADRELHLNFKLGADGEAIGLFDPDGRAVDTVTFLAQSSDISEGRFPDGAAAVFSMTTPTPRSANVVTATEVRVLSIVYDPINGVTLTWTAQSGKTYRVDYKNALADTDWTPLDGLVPANSNTASKTDTTITSVPQRFYKIVLLP